MPVRVTLRGSLPDLDRRSIEVQCEHCHLSTPAFLREVRLGNVIICRGCKTNIRLVDHLGSYQRARRKLDDVLRGMMAAFARR